jgi:hypothetical protein
LRQIGGSHHGTPVSYTIKTDRHDITDILLKVALSTKTLTLKSAQYVTINYHVNITEYHIITKNKKQKKYYTVGAVSKSKRIMIERGKIDTPYTCTQMHNR